MATFAELYGAQNNCAPRTFRRRVFWRTLHRPALPLAPLLLLTDYFDPDRSMLNACANATRMDQVEEEIEDYRSHPQNRGWLRRHANLRISTRRLRVLAAACLAKEPPGTGPVGEDNQRAAPAPRSQPAPPHQT